MLDPSHLDRFGDAFKGRKALITGGAGFIGSHLAHAIHALGAHVTVLDDLSGGFRENLPSGVELIEASVLDAAALERAIDGAAFVYHQAAMVSVPQSVEQPELCAQVNIVGTQGLLAAAKRAGAGRVCFAASAAAYGDTPTLPCSESHAPDVYSPYAASKVAGELLCATYARNFDLCAVALRYFNIFGPRQDPNSPYAAVISAFAKRLLAGGQPSIFGDGNQTRDFTYIDNVVLANLLASTAPAEPVAGRVFNIGTGERSNLLEVHAALNEALDTPLPGGPTFGPVRAGDVRDSVADISRARETLGYEPMVGLAEGLRSTMAWARTSPHFKA
ncbi:MAG: NAD-dependent epimerase/dehydratase family protein [Planctomycetota bacterium]